MLKRFLVQGKEDRLFNEQHLKAFCRDICNQNNQTLDDNQPVSVAEAIIFLENCSYQVTDLLTEQTDAERLVKAIAADHIKYTELEQFLINWDNSDLVPVIDAGTCFTVVKLVTEQEGRAAGYSPVNIGSHKIEPEPVALPDAFLAF